MWPAMDFLILANGTKSLLFCLRDDPLIVFRRQNHVIFVFIKTISHDLLVQVAYSSAYFTNYCLVVLCRFLCDFWTFLEREIFSERIG